MAKIVKKLTDLVGNTPLMELSGYCGKYGMEQNIIAKLEAFNPAGSVKDRVALSMIEDAEARGVLKPGATIIEPTSGNTGVGLAMVSTIKGYHLILTMPETMSLERRNLLKALGARFVRDVNWRQPKVCSPGFLRERQYMRPVCWRDVPNSRTKKS